MKFCKNIAITINEDLSVSYRAFVISYLHYNMSCVMRKPADFNPLAMFCGRTARFMSDLVGHLEDRFSQDCSSYSTICSSHASLGLTWSETQKS